MIVLISNNNAMYSGLVAAIISGVVSIIGIVVNLILQKKNNRKQRENVILYKNQVEWADNVRNIAADMISRLSRINDIRKQLNDCKESIINEEHSLDFIQKQSLHVDKLKDTFDNLMDEFIKDEMLLRLYLYDNDHMTKAILGKTASMIKELREEKEVSSTSYNEFIEIIRIFFMETMLRIEKQIQ